MAYPIGNLGRKALVWGALKTEIAQLRNCLEDRDAKIRDLATRLYQKTAELNRLRNHHDRLHPNPQGHR